MYDSNCGGGARISSTYREGPMWIFGKKRLSAALIRERSKRFFAKTLPKVCVSELDLCLLTCGRCCEEARGRGSEREQNLLFFMASNVGRQSNHNLGRPSDMHSVDTPGRWVYSSAPATRASRDRPPFRRSPPRTIGHPCGHPTWCPQGCPKSFGHPFGHLTCCLLYTSPSPRD